MVAVTRKLLNRKLKHESKLVAQPPSAVALPKSNEALRVCQQVAEAKSLIDGC